MSQAVGYLILWDVAGTGRRQAAAWSKPDGRLCVCGYAMIWPSRNAAMGAIRATERFAKKKGWVDHWSRGSMRIQRVVRP